MEIFNFLKDSDFRAWAIIFSGAVAFWGYTSSLRPYIHVYLSLGEYSKRDTIFNIVNNGKVGAAKVSITLEDGGTVIARFDEKTAETKKPFQSDSGEDFNLRIPIFHKDEVIPPNFHYETLLGRGSGMKGNEEFTKPFVLIVKYTSSLPVIKWIPYVGRFKEKLVINPRIFIDAAGTSSKEIIDINLSFDNNKIKGEAERKYP